MDLDSPYLEIKFLFESEETYDTASEDKSNEKAHDVDGFSSSDESERILSLNIQYASKAKLEGDLAAKV